MLQRILSLRLIIKQWQKAYKYEKGVDIRGSFLTNDDFEMLELWCSILGDFKDLCLAEENNSTTIAHGSAAGVLTALTCAYERLNEAEVDVMALGFSEEFLRPFLAGIKEALLKTLKYTALIEESDIYYAAVILNPNYRLL